MKALLTALLIVSLPAAAGATPDNQRFGGMVVFAPATGQDNTIAVWTGPVYGHSLFLEQLWG